MYLPFDTCTGYTYMLTKVYQLSSMKPVVYNLDDLSKNNVST